LTANRPKRNRKLAARNSSNLLWPAIIIVCIVAADQLTKFWAVESLINNSPVSVIGDFIRLSLVYNVGGAMGTSLGTPTYYLIVALIILPFILYYIYTHRNDGPIAIPLAFIAGGAIGNIIDRARLGRVIDFIDVDFFNISIGSFHLDRWWTFNVADAAIFCAMIFLVVYLMFFRSQARAARPGSDSGETDQQA
jgi:signal peptidase II